MSPTVANSRGAARERKSTPVTANAMYVPFAPVLAAGWEELVVIVFSESMISQSSNICENLESEPISLIPYSNSLAILVNNRCQRKHYRCVRHSACATVANLELSIKMR